MNLDSAKPSPQHSPRPILDPQRHLPASTLLGGGHKSQVGRHSQREGNTKTAKEDHPEQQGCDLRESARRARGHRQPSSKPSLGPANGHPGFVNWCEEVAVPEVRFNTRRCLHPCGIPARSLPFHKMLVSLCARTRHEGSSTSHTPINSLATATAVSKHDLQGTPSNSSTIN